MSLTTEQITALPVGATIYDRDGDPLTQVSEGRWGYTHLQDTDFYGPKDGPVSGLTFGPYTELPHLTAEELEAVPAGLRIQDRDGDQLTRRALGYTYSNVLADNPDPEGGLLLHLRAGEYPGPFTMVPLTPEEIDAMPVGSVIADADGDRITRWADGWRYSGFGEDFPASYRPVSCPPYALVPRVQEVANNA